MLSLSDYQLFLFDFDGLLADTERLHYAAYKRMLAEHDVDFNWSFDRYCSMAHYHATALRDALYEEFPQLGSPSSTWDRLYAEKKAAYISLVEEAPVPLMPGVKELLEHLAKQGVQRCVVTHSAKPLVDGIRAQQPILDSIPHWFTREDYKQPKPAPDGYLKAIDRLGRPGDRVIGFEDTPRGLSALLGTDATPVIVCAEDYPGLQDARQHERVHHIPSLEVLL